MGRKRNWINWGMIGLVLLIAISTSGAVQAQSGLDPSPPEETIKLIFLHHSVGENWLADDQGGLGLALQDNNYFVSDTYYGWGPDGIGDATDTLDWPTWFVGSESDRYMQAVFSESDANAAGYQYYTRTIADPGGENQVIMFKSCFPNSDIGGKPGDAAAPGGDLTVASAKYVYNQLLTYFETRPDKLFVVITSPPMQHISHPENIRALANWLVDDWLDENNYPLDNVMVFDFYNVLTDPDNHHRYNNGQIEHITGAGRDTLYYDSWGDDHPSAEGGQKATEEFIPLLNIAVNRWLATAPGGDGPRPAEPAAQEEPPAVEPRPMPTSSTMIDDFESGTHPESDYWVPYWDEAVATSINCNPSSGTVHQGSAALQIDFEVLADSWASCELLYYHPQDWQGEGLQFYLQSSQAGLPYGLLFYYQLGEERATSVVEFETLPESVGGWVLVSIPWEEFALQDSLVYPESGLGMAFVFGGTAGGTNSGTIWIDDLSLYMDVVEVVPVEPAAQEPAADKPAPVDDGQPSEGEPANQVDAPRSGLPFCANFPLVIGLAAAAGFGLKRRRTEF